MHGKRYAKAVTPLLERICTLIQKVIGNVDHVREYNAQNLTKRKRRRNNMTDLDRIIWEMEKDYTQTHGGNQ